MRMHHHRGAFVTTPPLSIMHVARIGQCARRRCASPTLGRCSSTCALDCTTRPNCAHCLERQTATTRTLVLALHRDLRIAWLVCIVLRARPRRAGTLRARCVPACAREETLHHWSSSLQLGSHIRKIACSRVASGARDQKTRGAGSRLQLHVSHLVQLHFFGLQARRRARSCPRGFRGRGCVVHAGAVVRAHLGRLFVRIDLVLLVEAARQVPPHEVVFLRLDGRRLRPGRGVPKRHLAVHDDSTPCRNQQFI
jgi:hypothetical protein